MHKKQPQWLELQQTAPRCPQKRSSAECSDSFGAGFEVPEPSEYTGLIKQNLQPACITMVTCEVGKKVNFPYNYRGVQIQRLVCSLM